MELKQYREKLLELCRKQGSINELDILSISIEKVKGSDFSEEQFLDMFNEVKEGYRNNPKGHKKLTGRTKTSLKQISKEYTLEEVKGAAHAMFMGGWALNTGNDTPTHLLTPSNFERYLNIFENGTIEAKQLSDSQQAKQRILGRFSQGS